MCEKVYGGLQQSVTAVFAYDDNRREICATDEKQGMSTKKGSCCDQQEQQQQKRKLGMV